MMLDKILRFSELQFTCKEGVKIALLPPESHYYNNFAQRMIGYTGGRCRYEDLQSPKHRHLGLSTGHDKTSVLEDKDGTLVFLVSPEPPRPESTPPWSPHWGRSSPSRELHASFLLNVYLTFGAFLRG